MEVLQYIEFASGDAADADGSHNMQLPNPKMSRIDARVGGTLEALFAQKNKKLQEENARLRVRIGRALGTLHLNLLTESQLPFSGRLRRLPYGA